MSTQISVTATAMPKHFSGRGINLARTTVIKMHNVRAKASGPCSPSSSTLSDSGILRVKLFYTCMDYLFLFLFPEQHNNRLAFTF